MGRVFDRSSGLHGLQLDTGGIPKFNLDRLSAIEYLTISIKIGED